jgi:membrane protein
MHWSEFPSVRRLRCRSSFVDVGIEVATGFGRHASGRNSAVLAYYGFLTLFPLIMVATTVLGFVLQGRPDLRDEIVDSAIAQIPVLGSQILSQSGDLQGNAIALAVGLAGALWGSTRAFAGLQSALDDVWEVPIDRRPSLVVRRVHSLVGLIVIGAGQLATVALTAISRTAGVPLLGAVFLLVGVAIVNTSVLASMFRYLTAARTTWAEVWPGALVGGVTFTGLQLVGTVLVTELLAGAQSVYGAFASVFAITAWLSVHATVALVSAELNTVLANRRVDSVGSHGETTGEIGVTG